MKVVVDTSVLVSGIFFGGVPGHLVAVHATMVDATPLAAPVSADPADDMFLAAARDGDALLIVSGDRHLLDVTGWQGVEVITPRTFTDRYVRGR